MSEQPKGMFDDFLNDYLRREHEATATSYATLLLPFAKWLNQRGLSNSFDRDDVVEFLETQPWSNATRNLFLAGLRSWAKDVKSKIPTGTSLEEIQRLRDAEKRMERVINLKGYKIVRKEKVPLTLEQIGDIFRSMDSWVVGCKDADIILWLLLWFGIRAGELKTLGDNIDWEVGSLVVATEKIGGTRKLFFDKYTAGVLKAAIDRGVLELPTATIRKRLGKYSHAIAPRRLNPHIARHTFASFFGAMTGSFTLKRVLGHGHESATDTYVHPEQEKIKELMLTKHFLKPLETFRNTEGEIIGA